MSSGHEVVGKLEKLGFWKIRQKGSHVIMRKYVSSGVTIGCVVPLHKELAHGTLRGILNQACITIDEFLKSLTLHNTSSWISKHHLCNLLSRFCYKH